MALATFWVWFDTLASQGIGTRLLSLMSTANATDHPPLEQLVTSSGASSRWRAFWLACFVMTVPMLIPYLAGMWDFEHYQYFPFTFLAVGYLVYARWDRTFFGPRGWLGWVLVGLALLLVIGSLQIPSAWLAGVGFVVLSFACLGALRGPDDRSLLVVGLPLLMLIQLPVGLDRLLILRLQGATTELASVCLDVFGVPHAVAGNIIQLSGRELFVAEACSGIQSVFTLAFLACVLVAWNRRRLWLTPLYLVIAGLLAVAGNVLRVTTVALAESLWEMDLADGWRHDLLGYVALAIAAMLLVSFDQLIAMFLHPATGAGETVHNPIIRGWNFAVAGWNLTDDEVGYGYGANPERSPSEPIRQPWLDRVVFGTVAWKYALGLVALVTLGGVAQAMRVEVNRDPEPLIREYTLIEPPADLLAGDYEVIKITDHTSVRGGVEPRLGQNADIWTCSIGDRGQLQGQFVLSQAYSGWHELCICYDNLDWDRIEREVGTVEPDSAAASADDNPDAPTELMPESFVTARFNRPDGQYGYLLFTAVNADGTVPAPPSSLGALGARLFSRLERHGVVDQQDLVMFQLWVVTPGKLDSELLEQLRADFVRARGRVAAAMRQAGPAESSSSSDPLVSSEG